MGGNRRGHTTSTPHVVGGIRVHSVVLFKYITWYYAVQVKKRDSIECVLAALVGLATQLMVRPQYSTTIHIPPSDGETLGQCAKV